jgi:3-oxoacyl-(acyl-carrier-protein) synthase
MVITGLGAVTPLASGVATSWARLTAAAPPAGAITAFDASGFPVSFKEFRTDLKTRRCELEAASKSGHRSSLVASV